MREEMVIKRYSLNDGRRLVIGYEDDSESPREWDNSGHLCLREHRRYKFPNELDYDFENESYYSEDSANSLTELKKKYHIFELDCYEHSGISFSLHGEGIQCKFDTSSNCGFIAIPKEFYPEEDIAKGVAEQEIKIYNQYLNGEVYRRTTEKPVKRTSEDGQEKIEREYEDGCGGYYDEKDILDEFKDLSPNEIE